MSDHSLIADVLKDWDVGSVIEIVDIYKGEVFEVVTRNGKFVVKNLGKLGRKQNHNLALQYDILKHLDQADVPVAVPIKNKGGQLASVHEDRLFILMPYFANGARPENADDRRKLYQNYGRAIAQLHLALTTFPSERLEGKSWKNEPATEMFRDIETLREHADQAWLPVVEDIVNDISEDMHEALSGLDHQLIHRDCHPSNVLADGTEVTGFVDCDHLSFGPRLLDLAYFVVHIIFRKTDDPDECKRWLNEFPLILEGYHQVGTLSKKERHAFPYMMFFVNQLFGAYLFRARGGEGSHYHLDAMVWMRDNLDAIRERSLGK